MERSAVYTITIDIDGAVELDRLVREDFERHLAAEIGRMLEGEYCFDGQAVIDQVVLDRRPEPTPPEPLGAKTRPEVPYPRGTRVRCDGEEWVVFDHHGGSWPEGEDVERVVLERWGPCPEHEEYERHNDCMWCANGVPIQRHTTWDRLEPI